MITAVFDNRNYATATGLWQWDYGQVLRIQGLDLPTAVEVHFSFSETGGESVSRIGTTRDGVTDVPIPDSMLECEDTKRTYYIYAFVYLIENDSGETKYKITIPVESRPKPYAFNAPEERELFEQAIVAVNEAADRANKAVELAESSAKKAEYAQAKAEQNVTTASDAANDASESSKKSEASASLSKEYALEAKKQAEESEKSARSLSAKVERTETGAKITVVDKSGKTTAIIKDGRDGPPGKDGRTPEKDVDYFDGKEGATYTPNVAQGGILYWTNESGRANPPEYALADAVADALPASQIATRLQYICGTQAKGAVPTESINFQTYTDAASLTSVLDTYGNSAADFHNASVEANEPSNGLNSARFVANGADPYVVFMSNSSHPGKRFGLTSVDMRYIVIKYCVHVPEGAEANAKGEFYTNRSDGIQWASDYGNHVTWDWECDGEWHLALVDARYVWGQPENKKLFFNYIYGTKLYDFRMDFFSNGSKTDDRDFTDWAIDIAYINFFEERHIAEAFMAYEYGVKTVVGQIVNRNHIYCANDKFYVGRSTVILTQGKEKNTYDGEDGKKYSIDNDHVYVDGVLKTDVIIASVYGFNLSFIAVYLPSVEVYQRTTGSDASFVHPDTTELAVEYPHWHKEGEWIIDYEPEVAVVGQKIKNCTSCGQIIRYEEIPALEGIRYMSNGDGTCVVEGFHSNSLVDVVIPPVSSEGDTVVEIAGWAFNEDTVLSVTVPDSVVKINSEAFAYCENLKSVTLGSGLREIAGNFAYDCDALERLVISPENPVYHTKSNCLIETASKTLVAGCKNSVIPDDGSVTAIGDNAFSDHSMYSVNIPDGVTSIGYCAFFQSDIQTFIIPSSIVECESGFLGCWGVSDVYYTGTEEEWNDSPLSACFNDYSPTIHYEYERGSLTYYSNGDGTCFVSDFGDCVETNLVIPSVSPDGETVKAIGDAAFGGHETLRRVVIPESVIEIQSSAFSGCTSLAEVTISEGVETIGDYAFSGCESLEKITIPEGVTTIGNRAFDSCSGLNEISIPSSVTEIGLYAFYSCMSLKSIYIPKNVAEIGDGAFSCCVSLSSIVFEENSCIQNIGPCTFYDCRKITSVIIPEGVLRIGEDAFVGCENLVSITIPSSMTEIEDAFDCGKLVEVINKSDLPLKKGSEEYGRVAFYALKLHDGETKIVEQGDYLFVKHKKVYRLLAYKGSDTYLELPKTCNGEQYELYDFAFYAQEELSNVILPEGISNIPPYAFGQCNSIYSIRIPESVTAIEEYAFTDCQYLEVVDIPESVETIGLAAFQYCENLKNVYLPEGVMDIDSNAFSGCLLLEEIEIPASVISIGQTALNYCPALQSIKVREGNETYHSQGNCLIETDSKTLVAGCKNSVIPDDGSVTAIGSWAFSGCSNLTELTIPNGVTRINDWAFASCGGLTSISIAGIETRFGRFAFNNCKGIIQRENGVDYVDKRAIYYSLAMTSIVLRDDTIGIASYAFSGASSLESIFIPISLKYIGPGAIVSCSKLTDIYYYGSEKDWSEISIEGNNTSLSNATIHYNYAP